MKRLSVLSALAALSLAFAGSAMAATCTYPHSSAGNDIPHGATASAAEMKAAQQKVGTYVNELEAYIKCVDNQPRSQRAHLMESRNNAVTEAKDLAKKINREIRRFNRSAQLRQAST